MASDNKGIAKILAIIGGVLVIIDGALSLLNELGITLGFSVPGAGGFLGFLGAIINAIITIVLGVVILISAGAVKSKKGKVAFNGIVVLILGILTIFFGSWLAAILVIIAAILLLI